MVFVIRFPPPYTLAPAPSSPRLAQSVGCPMRPSDQTPHAAFPTLDPQMRRAGIEPKNHQREQREGIRNLAMQRQLKVQADSEAVGDRQRKEQQLRERSRMHHQVFHTPLHPPPPTPTPPASKTRPPSSSTCQPPLFVCFRGSETTTNNTSAAPVFTHLRLLFQAQQQIGAPLDFGTGAAIESEAPTSRGASAGRRSARPAEGPPARPHEAGAVPAYLRQRKAQWAAVEAADAQRAAAEAECPPGLRLVGEAEKGQILQTLADEKAKATLELQVWWPSCCG